MRDSSLIDLGSEIYSSFERMVELPVMQINMQDSIEYRYVYMNFDVFRDHMNESLAYRERDFVQEMPEVQLELIIAGVIAFGLCVVVATPLFYAAVRDISERTQAVTLLLLHVPRRLAKALKDRAQAGLDRIVAQAEDQAMAMTQSPMDNMGGGGGGLADDEEEKRLLVEEDEGEEAYRAVLRAAQRQVQRRI